MFTHCGGKDRLPVIIAAMKTLDVPVAAVADFDVLRDEQPLRRIYESLGGTWPEIAKDWHIIKRAVDDKGPKRKPIEVKQDILAQLKNVSTDHFPREITQNIQAALRQSSPWAGAKSVGKSWVPHGEARQACDQLLDVCKRHGLHIVETGELESFYGAVGGHGPKWVNAVLKEDLPRDQNLEDARRFVSQIVGG